MPEEIKYFTPKEAQKTLPLVRKIVEDILKEGREIKQIAGVIKSDIQENEHIKAKVEVIKNYVDELAEIGCYYKNWDFTIGLIDFPSVIDNKEVYLCWRSDEPEIRFYHEVETGFAGRKPIPDYYFN